MKKVIYTLFFLVLTSVIYAQKGDDPIKKTAKISSKTALVQDLNNNPPPNVPIDIDLPCPPGETKWYIDNDGDGYGAIGGLGICAATQPLHYVANQTDCDDNDAGVHSPQIYYHDNDGDGYGAGFPEFLCTSTPPSNLVTNNTDCDDYNAALHTAITWYEDADHDNFGDPNSTVVSCTAPPNYVANNTDNCPTVYGTDAGCPPPPPAAAENMNWIISKTYNIQNDVTSHSKVYFDELGKSLQAQVVDMQTNKTWASQTMYDTRGRAALQTLSAPLYTTGEFLYSTNFIKKTDGSTFTPTDFETIPESPATVGTQANSLGWYYSENNTSEPYQDITNYPYSRAIYSKLRPGAVQKSLGGNKVSIDGTLQWANGFGHSMPAAQEMYYVFGKDYFGNPNETSSEEVVTKFFKSVSIGVDGVESVVFTDGEGKTLAAARTGGTKKYDVVSVIGVQGYIDIHIPKGIVNSDIQFLSPSSEYKIYDLRTEEVVSPSAMTGGHIYRVEYMGTIDPSEIETYILPDGTVTDHHGKGLRYKVNYYDYTLNYYDEAGRLLKTIQPLGFNDSCLDMVYALPSHQMASEYTYNALSQVVETSSPDQGAAKFVYRKDGQIRYSQSLLQATNHEFSYTNYDEYARPIESGVYFGSKSFEASEQIGFNLVDKVQIKEEGNTISKIAQESWNSAIQTTKKIHANGAVSFTINSLNDKAIVALSTTHNNYNNVDYALFIGTNHVHVYENGVFILDLGSYTTADVFKIERQGSTIKYSKNNTVLHTRAAVSTDLLAEVFLHSPEAKINDFTLTGNIISPTVNYYTHVIGGLTVSASNQVTKTSGANNWDAAIKTTARITGDGGVRFRVDAIDKFFMAGLSSHVASNSTGFGEIDYALYLNGSGNIYVYESGGYIRHVGSCQVGDVLKVSREANIVRYWKNSSLIYQSETFSYDTDLIARAAIKSLGTTVTLQFSGDDTLFSDYYNIETQKNSIRKLAGYSWNAGFASSEKITGDGYVAFTASSYKRLMVGLSPSNANASYNTISYALYITPDRHIVIYESGSYKGAFGNYQLGDILKVERVGNTVQYYRNDTSIYTSASTTNSPLLIDTSFYQTDAQISNLKLVNIASTSSIVTADDVLNPAYCKERTLTVYDKASNDLASTLSSAGISPSYYPKQRYVAGGVAKTYTLNPNTDATWYSYDIYGRMEWMIQNITGLDVKTIDYEYDEVLGTVTKVIYQKHKASEMFVHQYSYNDVGQLIAVATSTNGTTFTPQATYEYYETGALKRTVLGDHAQGLDYVYNLAGQLKAINHPSLTSAKDPGGDSNDAFGINISYYSGDYARTNTPTPIQSSPTGTDQLTGNIKNIIWGNKKLSTTQQFGQAFQYNNNAWLKEASFGTVNPSTAAINLGSNYKVSNLNYDANGNILSLNRNAYGTAMDQFSYKYKGQTNQLTQVTDAVDASGLDDLDNQNADNYVYNAIGQLIVNKQDGVEYVYNASGLVTQIKKHEVEAFTDTFTIGLDGWGGYNTSQVTVNNTGQTLNLSIKGMYNSISKYVTVSNAAPIHIEFDFTAGTLLRPHLFIREKRSGTWEPYSERDYIVPDASGHYSIDAIIHNDTSQVRLYFEKGGASDNGTFTTFKIDNFSYIQMAEEAIPVMNISYNSSGQRIHKESTADGGTTWAETYYVRDATGNTLGVYSGSYGGYSVPLSINEYTIFGSSRLGVYKKSTNLSLYQLTDHLGNVRAVVRSDTGVASNGTDYYPFGMAMPARLIADQPYRYTYQGQEKDPETGKEAFQLRLWDGRIGRWLTTDPKGQYFSPYLGMGNNPINGIDPDGGFLTKISAWWWMIKNGGDEIVGVKGNYSVVRKEFGFDVFHSSRKKPIVINEESFLRTIGKGIELNNNFHRGIEDRANEIFYFWDYQVSDPIYWNKSFTEFGESLIDGTNSIYIFSDKDYQFRVLKKMYGMSANEWAYSAGYSSPDIVLGSVGGAAISGLSRVRNLRLMGSYNYAGVRNLRLMGSYNYAGGKIKFQIGVRNIKTNYHFRFERHRHGGVFTPPHINYGIGGKNHFPPGINH